MKYMWNMRYETLDVRYEIWDVRQEKMIAMRYQTWEKKEYTEIHWSTFYGL